MLNKLLSKLLEFLDKPFIEESTEELVERPHPEVENYGLNCDYKLWAEFNKEKLIRNWIKSSRQFAPKEHIPTKRTPEHDYGNDMERDMAEVALEELVDFGYLNPITYIKMSKK